MEAASQKSRTIQILLQCKIAGQFLFGLSQKTYELGREARLLVNRILSLSETLNSVKLQAIELEGLKQKIILLEAERCNVEDLKTQLFDCQCKLVLLEKGHRFAHKRSF